MSVIIARALPDVRDGLKPVHRRILYTQHQLNNTWNRPYLKSARVVGDCMGKFHPARRRVDLRRRGAHGAGLLAALPARRRPGQLGLHRRRSRRGHALHRGAHDPARRRDARRHRQRDGRLAAELRRQGARADRPAGARSQPAHQRHHRHRRRHGDQHPAAQHRRDHRRRGRAHRRRLALGRRADAAHPRPRLPDRGLHLRPPGHPRSPTTPGAARSSCAARRRSRRTSAGAARSSSPKSRTW